MKNRIALVLVACLLTGCASTSEQANKKLDYEYVKAERVENTLGEPAPNTSTSKYISAPVSDSLSDDAVAVEEEVSDNVVHTTILPGGMHYEGNIIYTDNPQDYNGNVIRYSQVTDLSGNRIYTKAEALAYAEIDFVESNDNYDGSRPLEKVTVSQGSMSLRNDYKLPEGKYTFMTDLPISHVTVYADGGTQKFGEYWLTSDKEDALTIDIRKGMYVHGNSLQYNRIGDLNMNGITTLVEPDVSIEAYSISQNVIKYEPMDRRQD